MKKFAFLTLISTVLCVAAFAQTAIKVKNNSACTVYYTLSAAPTCPATVAVMKTTVMSVPAGQTVGVMLSNATWEAGAPPTGSIFISAKFFGSVACQQSGVEIGCGGQTSATLSNTSSCSSCPSITGTYSSTQQLITFN